MPLTDCKFVWKNGTLVPWDQALVQVSCHGLHYGTGVFEGMRCYDTRNGPAVFRLAAHLDRWFASAKVYGLEWSYIRDELARAVLEVIRSNGFQSCYVRPIAFYGSHTLSVHPRGCPSEVVIFAWPWGAYLGSDAIEKGIDVCVSPWRKFSSHAIPAKFRATGQYLNSVLAIQDAVARGFGEAILLDDRGQITEGSGENLFLVKDEQLYTNDAQTSVLLGITRDGVLRLALDLALSVHIGAIELNQLLQADEAFFTGTAAEVTPIATVDLKRIGTEKPGPITAMLRKNYLEAATGGNFRYNDWLTYVSWEHSKTELNNRSQLSTLH